MDTLSPGDRAVKAKSRETTPKWGRSLAALLSLSGEAVLAATPTVQLLSSPLKEADDPNSHGQV